MGLINRKKADVEEEFVSLREIAREVGCDPKTVRNRINDNGWHFPIERKFKAEVVAYLKDMKKLGWDKKARPVKKVLANVVTEEPDVPSEETSEKTCREASAKDIVPDTVFNSKKNYGWHVSVRGKLGWIVIHVGPKEEMESWHKLFLRNEIESKVEENQKILMAYDIGLNS